MSQRRHRRSQTCWQLGVRDSKGPARALQGLLQREAPTTPPRQRRSFVGCSGFGVDRGTHSQCCRAAESDTKGTVFDVRQPHQM